MKFKAFLTGKSITTEQYEAMTDAEKAALFIEYNEAAIKAVQDALAAKVDAEKMAQSIKDEIAEQFKDQYTPGEIKTKLDEVDERVQQLVDNNEGDPNKYPSIFDAVKEQLLAQKESIQEMKTNSGAKIKIKLGNTLNKAVADMTFATHITGRVGRQEREAGIVEPTRRTVKLFDIVNVSPTNAQTYSWIEKTGIEGGVTMVAEGTVKPQGDFDLVEVTQSPKKAALVVTVSKEMLNDIDDMARTVEEEIRTLLNLFLEDAILTGDGTGNNIAGIDANATTWAAGVFANTVDLANVFDVARVAYNQVNLNEDDPTYFVMHPSDATTMDLVKDATTGIYIMPPFLSAGGTMIRNIPVITSTLIAADQLYCGNFSKFKVKIRENVELEMGYRGANDDWVKNLISFLGEARLFAFIPAAHYGSIVKADISTAKAALETP